MTVFTTILFLGAFSVLIGMPENILAHPTSLQSPFPHEEWKSCGTACESTCQDSPDSGNLCIAVCRQGHFCEPGYIREFPNGKCILPSECPPRA